MTSTSLLNSGEQTVVGVALPGSRALGNERIETSLERLRTSTKLSQSIVQLHSNAFDVSKSRYFLVS